MTAMALSAIENQLDAIASNALAPYESPEGILLSTSVYKLKHLSNFESKCFTTRALSCRDLGFKKGHDLKVWYLRGLPNISGGDNLYKQLEYLFIH